MLLRVTSQIVTWRHSARTKEGKWRHSHVVELGPLDTLVTKTCKDLSKSCNVVAWHECRCKSNADGCGFEFCLYRAGGEDSWWFVEEVLPKAKLNGGETMVLHFDEQSMTASLLRMIS